MALSSLPLPLDRSFPLNQPFHGLVMFTGHASALTLSQLLCLQYLRHGDPVVLVDGANAYNALLLSEAARAERLDLRVMLDALRLSRVYTCHQLEALITEHLQPAIATLRPRAILCLGLLDPLADEDVPAAEATRIFRRMLPVLTEISCHLPLLAACPDPGIPVLQRRELHDGFGRRLLHGAPWHFVVRPGDGGGMWISRERPDPARWEWTARSPADRQERPRYLNRRR
jgi:hypothetical protein